MGKRGRGLILAGCLLCAAGPAAGGTPAPAPALPSVAPGETRDAGAEPSIEELWAQGEALFERGDAVAALRLFEAALARDPARARSWNYVGGAHFVIGDLSRALEHFRRAVELDPRDVRALNNLGTGYERLGDYPRAEEVYLRAAALDPAHAPTQLNLGILYARRLALPEAARRAWQRFLELSPAGADADQVRRELEALQPPASPGSPAPPAPGPSR